MGCAFSGAFSGPGVRAARIHWINSEYAPTSSVDPKRCGEKNVQTPDEVKYPRVAGGVQAALPAVRLVSGRRGARRWLLYTRPTWRPTGSRVAWAHSKRSGHYSGAEPAATYCNASIARAAIAKHTKIIARAPARVQTIIVRQCQSGSFLTPSARLN